MDGYRLFLDLEGNVKVIGLFTWEENDYPNRWLNDEWYTTEEEALKAYEEFLVGQTQGTWWRLCKFIDTKSGTQTKQPDYLKPTPPSKGDKE